MRAPTSILDCNFNHRVYFRQATETESMFRTSSQNHLTSALYSMFIYILYKREFLSLISVQIKINYATNILLLFIISNDYLYAQFALPRADETVVRRK